MLRRTCASSAHARASTPAHARDFAYTLHRSRKDALVVLTSPEAYQMTVPAPLRPHLCRRLQPRLCSPTSSLRLGSVSGFASVLLRFTLFTAPPPTVRKLDFAHKCAHQSFLTTGGSADEITFRYQ